MVRAAPGDETALLESHARRVSGLAIRWKMQLEVKSLETGRQYQRSAEEIGRDEENKKELIKAKATLQQRHDFITELKKRLATAERQAEQSEENHRQLEGEAAYLQAEVNSYRSQMSCEQSTQPDTHEELKQQLQRTRGALRSAQATMTAAAARGRATSREPGLSLGAAGAVAPPQGSASGRAAKNKKASKKDNAGERGTSAERAPPSAAEALSRSQSPPPSSASLGSALGSLVSWTVNAPRRLVGGPVA